MASHIQFDANPPGSVEVAYTQLGIEVECTISGVPLTSPQWVLFGVPTDSIASLDFTDRPVVHFTPDKVGSYLLRLLDGTTEIEAKVYVVKTDYTDYRVPSQHETTESDEDGWSGKVNETLLSTGQADYRGITLIARNDLVGDANRGDVVVLGFDAVSGVVTIDSLALDTDVVEGVLLGIVISRYDGDGATETTARAWVTVKGRCAVSDLGAPPSALPYGVTISSTPGVLEYATVNLVGYAETQTVVWFNPEYLIRKESVDSTLEQRYNDIVYTLSLADRALRSSRR